MNERFEDEVRHQLRLHAAAMPVGDGDVDELVTRARRRQVAGRVAVASVAVAAIGVVAMAAPAILPGRAPSPVPVSSNERVAPTPEPSSPGSSSSVEPTTVGDTPVRDLLLTAGNLVVVADGVRVIAHDGTTTVVPAAEASVGWAWADGRGGVIHQPSGDEVVRVVDGRVERLVALGDYEPLRTEASVLPGERIVLDPQALRLADVDPVAHTMLVVVEYGAAEWFSEGREVTMTVRIDTGEVLSSFEEHAFEAAHSYSLAGEFLSFASSVEVIESVGLMDQAGRFIDVPWAADWVDDNGGLVVRDVELVPGGDAVALVTRDGTIRIADRGGGTILHDVPGTGLGSLSDASTETVVGQATHWAAGAFAEDVDSLVVDLATGSVTQIDGRATLVHGVGGS